jgi:adenine-specific DNA-methyltransferase
LYLIENCIYGVDIQPIAIQISKLRFFISLIVDQKVDKTKENLGIRSLPNLETKFVAANTLIGLEKPQKTLLQNPKIDELEEKIKDNRHDYFNANNRKKKLTCQRKDKELREEISKLLEIDGWTHKTASQISEYDPYDQNTSSTFFDPEWMFGIKNNFDIVIGNPPYIEFKKLPATEKAKLTNFSSAKGKYDIYVIFDECSCSFLKTNGVMCFIQPTTFMKKDFGQESRNFIKKNYKIKSILDFADIQVFEGVTNYTGVFLFIKSKREKKYKFEYHQYFNPGKAISISDFQNSICNKNTTTIKYYLEIEDSELEKSIWNFHSDSTNILLSKWSANTRPLSELTVSIFQGIASGKDEVFYINSEIIKEQKIEKGILKRILKGKDVKKYSIEWAGYYVIYPYDKNSQVISEATLEKNFPYAYEYLRSCKEILKGRDYFDNSTKKWYELWNQRSYERFKIHRIICPEISDRNNFVISDLFYGNTKTYHIIPHDRSIENYYYLLGLLNSKLLDFIYKKITTPQAGGFYAYKTQFLSSLPIKIASNKQPIVNIVSEILKEKENNLKANTSELENQIDMMAYKLYELDYDEIKVIDPEIEKIISREEYVKMEV